MREQPGQRSYLPGEKQTEASHDQEIETVLDEFIRKVTQPTIQGGPVLPVEHIAQPLKNKTGRQLPIARGQGELDGFVHQSTVRVPGCRFALQVGYTVGPQLRHDALAQTNVSDPCEPWPSRAKRRGRGTKWRGTRGLCSADSATAGPG
jgi:hypothetical protein